MDKKNEGCERTHELLIKHYRKYPKLQVEDIFKYIFQSAFGCEHFISNEDTAIEYIKREYETTPKISAPLKEPLDGEYSRIYLSCLDIGLRAETLAKLFCLSTKKESSGRDRLEEKLQVAKCLVADGDLPFDLNDFEVKVDKWRFNGYPAVHHSDAFRAAYRPSYRVIANKYADYLQVFSEIDRLLCKDSVIVAVEGGSASGKSTLAGILQEVYDCSVFHMDDFFLRPEQRTPQRFAEIGGNIDRERFLEEVLQPLKAGKAVSYRRFDCSTQTLGDMIRVPKKKLTIIEGVYSMHSAFLGYYDLTVFLDIDPAYQKKRILIRNSAQFAQRFFDEWIPLEDAYFTGVNIKNRADLIIPITENSR